MTIHSETRPAFRNATAEDAKFLQQLFAATNETLRLMPLPMRSMMAEMQYRAKAMSYATMYPELEDRILCLDDGTPVGRHLVHRAAGEVRTVDIAVLPQHQRQGIGSTALGLLQQECAESGALHRLSVAKGNPAEMLYRRLGFMVTGADEMYLHMSYGANASIEREIEVGN